MYPEKPISGTARNTKPSRNSILARLNANVMPVLPRPCRILESVPDMYRKGQTKESARIWLAAMPLSKRTLPRISANVKKNRKHMTPSKKQRTIVR